MKRLGALVMAILLITGCNAMQPNMEETELLWAETEKNIQKWAISTKAEASPAEKPRITPEPTVEIPQNKPALTEKPTPQTPAPTTTLEQDTTEPESTVQPAQVMPQQAEPHEASPVMIDWPYPRITCPPESTPEPDWPYITAPEPPNYMPEPESTELPQEQPTPTPVHAPVDPAQEPMEQPADPTPEPSAEQPSSSYTECSCGTRLTPEELVPHMKAHALIGENHSYRAY